MPANLPPEYFEAERQFKEASSPSEKVAALEALIATVPKHKGTDKLRADLRRRLSRLRDEAVRRKKGGKGASLYTVPKEGAAQVALVGFANAGKSALLAALTNARPVVADYPMSTVMPLPGMMPYEDIQLQLVDLPPIGNESTDGWVSSILRMADILLLVVDLTEDPEVQAALLMEQLSQWNIPTGRGAKKAVIAANKADAAGTEEALGRLSETYRDAYSVVGVSAGEEQGIEELRNKLFETSDIIRVYTKEPGKEADLGTPYTMPAGSTVLELAQSVHKDFVSGLKYACIWGSSKFPGQRVQKTYLLKDKDIVELHL